LARWSTPIAIGAGCGVCELCLDNITAKGDPKFMLNAQQMSLSDAAAVVEISPTVLRRWLDEFSDFISTDAVSPADGADLRFSEADISLLKKAKAQMDEGLSFEQVRRQFKSDPPTEDEPESPPKQLVSAQEETAMAAMSYFSEIVDELNKGQLSVLNSQAANRELMGVLIQDNFNLKEENKRLRERMLDVERHVSQLRREEISRRESLRQEIEAKLSEIRMQVMRNPVTVLQERTGCLGWLVGSKSDVKTIPTDQPSHPMPPRPPRPPGPPE